MHQSVLIVNQIFYSFSVLAAYLASQYLSENGLLVLTGAAAALNGTPSMLSYGMSKAAVHHLVKSLASDEGGLPKGAQVACLLP